MIEEMVRGYCEALSGALSKRTIAERIVAGPARVVDELLGDVVDGTVGLGGPDQLRNGVRQRVELPLAGAKGCFHAFAFSDLLGGDVDADDPAIGIAKRVPIGDPGAVFILIGPLACNLDTDDRFAGRHD